MNRRVCMSMVFGGIFMLNAGAARSQNAAPLPPRQMAMVQIPGPEASGMIGERIELLGFEGLHGGKVVTGAPFTAVAVSETIQTLADGNHITRKTQTNLFRDSEGRFRKEVTLPAIGPLATLGQPNIFVFIKDPVAGTNFILHPDVKIAEKMEAPASKMNTMKGNIQYQQQQAIAEGSMEKEDLGTQTMAGLSAQGTRITHTISPGQMGNEKAMTVVFEQWYSNDLQMVVMSKRSDPRFGDTTYTVTNIQRSEPAASLFTVPSDYTVTAGKNKMYRRFNGGLDAAPPPAPPDN
jgi:hypothetical protein